MSLDALIKLARVVNADTQHEIDNGTPADLYVQRRGLRLLNSSGVPLVVDHDLERPVGVVHRLLEFNDTDGPWLWAKATISSPPDWLKQGTRCSYGWSTVHRSAHGWVHDGLLSEVSVLSSAQTPVESRAHVAVLKPKPSPAGGPSVLAGEVIHRPGERLVRHSIGRVTGIR